jgi:hypothetical protein
MTDTDEVTNMERRKLLLPLAVAGLATVIVAGAVAGQDPDDEADGQNAATETREGTIEAVTDADGDVEYQLTDADGTVKLSVGPPWFWGDDHPLQGLSGPVTVTGQLDDGTPPAHANRNNRADGQPSFDVFSINGQEIRGAGKPPWAGGPAVVGESHPGYQGWLRGQEASGGAAGGNADD